MLQRLLLKELYKRQQNLQITSIGKSKEKEKSKEKPDEIYIPPEKRQKIIDDLKLF